MSNVIETNNVFNEAVISLPKMLKEDRLALIEKLTSIFKAAPDFGLKLSLALAEDRDYNVVRHLTTTLKNIAKNNKEAAFEISKAVLRSETYSSGLSSNSIKAVLFDELSNLVKIDSTMGLELLDFIYDKHKNPNTLEEIAKTLHFVLDEAKKGSENETKIFDFAKKITSIREDVAANILKNLDAYQDRNPSLTKEILDLIIESSKTQNIYDLKSDITANLPLIASIDSNIAFNIIEESINNFGNQNDYTGMNTLKHLGKVAEKGDKEKCFLIAERVVKDEPESLYSSLLHSDNAVAFTKIDALRYVTMLESINPSNIYLSDAIANVSKAKTKSKPFRERVFNLMERHIDNADYTEINNCAEALKNINGLTIDQKNYLAEKIHNHPKMDELEEFSANYVEETRKALTHTSSRPSDEAKTPLKHALEKIGLNI